MGRAAVRGVTRNVARTQPPDPSGRELLISPRAMADRFVASPTHGFAFPYPRWSARPLPLSPVPHSGGPCLPLGFHILCVCLGDPPPMGAIVSRPVGLRGTGHPRELSAPECDRGDESWVKQRIRFWKCEVCIRRTVGFHHVRPTHRIPKLPSPRESFGGPRASLREDPLYPLLGGNGLMGVPVGPVSPSLYAPGGGEDWPEGVLSPPPSE